jgi:hypothetical protein
MKRVVKLFIVGLMFTTGSIYAAGIPVIDGVANGLTELQTFEQGFEYEEVARLLEKL